VSYDDGATWETTATTSSLVEKDSEDCGYTPPTQYDITNIIKGYTIKVADNISDIEEIEIDGIVQPNVATSYTLTTSEHTVKYKLTGTTLGNYTFYDCDGIKSSIIGNNITSIGDCIFLLSDGIESCTIGSGVTSIGNQFFEANQKLTAITINSNNTSYDSRNNCNAIIETATNTLLYGCNTTIIPNTVTSINYGAFWGYTSLTSVTIPDSVTSIGDNAFYYCSGLKSVTIGNGITTIGVTAFRYCSSLTSITVNADVPPILEDLNVFDNTNNCPIYVPRDSVAAYKAATNWSAYASRIEAIP
jgi:hypothetical protein